MRTISRDPFTRTELVRQPCGPGCECTECGQPARYRYGTVHDDRPGRPDWARGRFCSIACYRTHHEVT